MKFTIVFAIVFMLSSPGFKQAQLTKARVRDAFTEKEKIVREYFTDRGIRFEGFHLFIRAFKNERILEAWVKTTGSETYELLQTYAFCTSSGIPGPKRREGDLQIPEGVYHVNHFNPESNFHLSLGVSYPNASDKILGDKTSPGGAIYIHGNCVSIGCIPITDDKIKELYILAVEAKNNGQEKIPIHIFPCKLSDDGLRQLVADAGEEHRDFWVNLKAIYDNFEQSGEIRKITVDNKGRYTIQTTLER